MIVGRWQRFNTSHKQNAQCSGNTKNGFKSNWQQSVCYFYVAILVDFVFKFWYEPLEWCQKYISVKSHFCQKCLCEILSRCHLNYHDVTIVIGT